MVDNLVRHKHYLQVLCAHGHNSNFNASLFKCAPDSLIIALASLAHNTLTGVVPVSQGQIKELKKHRNYLHTLASHEQNVKTKRSFLIKQAKTGDCALPLLINIVLKALENSDYYQNHHE